MPGIYACHAIQTGNFEDEEQERTNIMKDLLIKADSLKLNIKIKAPRKEEA